jgi:hypothetical protein
LVADWSIALSSHFAGEEAIEHFGTLAKESPSLAVTIADLRAEHASMLEDIESLAGLSNDLRRRDELARNTRELIGRFAKHEQTETAALREFFETFARRSRDPDGRFPVTPG